MSVDEETLQELGLVNLEKAESGFHQSIQIYHRITQNQRINYTGEALLDH